MKLSYKFMDAETGALLTKAESNQMAVEVKTKDSLWACPACFVDKVRAFLANDKVV
jgi:acyl-CoA thioester hydrolase